MAEQRPTIARLFEREKEARPERVLAGERVRLRKMTTRTAWIRVRPEPNAPLLKRIVRYPYRLHTTFPRRHKVFEAAMVKRERVGCTRPAARVSQEARGVAVTGNPLRTAPTGYRRRGPLPTVTDWLGGASE